MMQENCCANMDPAKKQAVQETLAALIKKMLGDDESGEGDEATEVIAEAKPEEQNADQMAAEGEGEEGGQDGDLMEELKNYMNPKREPKRALMMTAMKIKGQDTSGSGAEQRKMKGKYLG